MPAFSGAVELAMTGSDTCVRSGEGEVRCFGPDAFDHDDPTSNSLGKFDQIVAGSGHFCGRRGGGVVCWGDNSSGQLGDGTRTKRATPTPVRGLGQAKHIAAGGDNTCAIEVDGTLRCWGFNRDGQSGDGVAGSELPNSPGSGPSDAWSRMGPGAPVALTGVKDVIVGGQHICAVADGVYCWGNNSVGQIGNGYSHGLKSKPARVVSMEAPRDISLGMVHSCALDARGAAYCWGVELMMTAATVAKKADQGPFVELSSQDYGTCGRRADDSVACFRLGLEPESVTFEP
jgi:alpha-tubulin suppressor-like RCC1 family protein